MSTNSFWPFVKPRQILLFIGFVAVISYSFVQYSPLDKKPSEKVLDIYISNLTKLRSQLKKLRASFLTGPPVTQIRKEFQASRLVFKQMAYITDFFNPYESKLLNGAALARTEEDNPHNIIQPQGFQVIEEIVYGNWDKNAKSKAISELDKLLQTLNRLENEPDFKYKFSDELIFNALRSSLIRLASLGITGFDSPVSEQSLPEAKATLEGIALCIQQYRPLIQNVDHGLYTRFQALIKTAQVQLNNRSFDTFDRLSFIKNHIDPLFAIVGDIRKVLQIPLSSGRMPLNQQARSIMDPTFFNPDFFSPNERYRMTPERISLGKRLFSDPMLSGNGKRSCASCHKAELAFTDGLRLPPDIDDKGSLGRNTPTLWNSVFQTRQFFDSRTATLENQLSDVVHNTREMQGSLQQNITQLANDPSYAAQFNKAYQSDADKITKYNIANAIASYIRSLIALNSRFDQTMRGDLNKMTASEKHGFNLFMGKAKCATCHFFPLFNGLVPPEFTETESEVLGVPKNKSRKKPELDGDEGKSVFTRSPVQRFAFKTPTLRNIELTAPYMHNGVFDTLEEVMEFYNQGGGAGLKIAPDNQTLPREPLQLTKKEIADVIAFMKTLTDTTISKR